MSVATMWIGQHLPNNLGEINLQQRQNHVPIPAYLTYLLALLTFIIPVLINLIELKFQKAADSVFQVHPATTMIAVVSLLTFAISFAITLNLMRIYFTHADVPPAFAAVLHATVVFSGSLSLLSLASLLLPDALRPFLYACCGLLSLGYSLSLVTGYCRGFLLRIMERLHTTFSGTGGRRPPPILTIVDIRHADSSGV